MAKARVHQEISPFIHQALLIVLLIGWLASLVPSLVSAATQLATNPNLSAYYTTFLYSLFLPVVSFLIFMAWKRRKAGMALVVESLILTVIVVTVAMTISGIARFVIDQFHVVIAGSLGWWYVEVVACLASTIATFSVLWYARRLGKW